MAAWRISGAVFIAAVITACANSPEPASLASENKAAPQRSAYEISIPCADLAERRRTETNRAYLTVLEYSENACALPTDDISLCGAKTALAGKSLALIAESETLTLF